MREYTTILVEKSADRVVTVTLNRPERMNSYNLALLDEFKAFWAETAAGTGR